MSCVSLASSSSYKHGHSYGNSYSSQSSAGFSTAPTSVASTPGVDTQNFDLGTRIRLLDGEIANNASSVPRSVPLPADMRPTSKDAILAATSGAVGVLEDYFTKPLVRVKELRKRKNFNFWADLPHEIAVHILQFLGPRKLSDAPRCRKHGIRCALTDSSGLMLIRRNIIRRYLQQL